MTETAKNEAPLAWTSKSEWGSVGNTHRASVTLDNGDRWSFVVDQPRKGQWTARGWRADRDVTGSGDMVFYREDRTMKGAKAQCQAQANLAQTSTCDECRKIGGHKLDCSTGRALAAEAMKGQRLTLRSTAEYVDQYGAGPDVIKPLPQRTPADAIRTVAGRVLRFVPGTVKHPVQICDDQDCPTHGDAGRVGPCVQDATPTQHTWVTATDGDTGATLDYQHCGVCGVRRCTWLPGDATTACDHDPDCPTHGDDIARRCHGPAA